MKTLMITAAFLAGSLALLAQNAPIDFEQDGHGADWTWTTFENDSNPMLEIVDNPDASGVNTSATVAKFTALDAGQPFAGCESMHGADIGSFTLDATNSTIKIKVWKSVISDVGIKLVAFDNASLGEIKIANTVVDQWEEITYDFSSNEGWTFDQIVIFPDFADRTQDNICYFDDISFGVSVPLPEPMEPAPDPTIDEADVLSMYSNVYTDVPVDTWQTGWSVANHSEIQIDGNDTHLYQVLEFVGIETTGANLIDASGMDYFHVDVWTPNMTTVRIKWVDFGADAAFDGGDDSEHELIFDNHAQEEWVSYMIPMSDFAGLNATTNLAQLIFSGLPAGTSTLYVDNIYFSKTSTSIVESDENGISAFPNPVSADLTITSPNVISQIHIYNHLGQLVHSQASGNSVERVSVDHLPAGNYQLGVLSGSEWQWQSVIVE